MSCEPFCLCFCLCTSICESAENTGHSAISSDADLLLFFLSGQRCSEIFPGVRVQLLGLLSVVRDSGQLSERPVAGHVPSHLAVWFSHGGCLHLHGGPEVRLKQHSVSSTSYLFEALKLSLLHNSVFACRADMIMVLFIYSGLSQSKLRRRAPTPLAAWVVPLCSETR